MPKHGKLKKYNDNVAGEQVSKQLEYIIEEDFCVTDEVREISDNYGNQLYITIKKVFFKSIEVTKYLIKQ